MFKKVQWGNYPSHLKVLLAELYDTSTFSDVTIICDGNKKIRVHKVILALYSGFFNDLFRHNDDEDVIIMPEINHKDMVVIFDLMFTGKTLRRKCLRFRFRGWKTVNKANTEIKQN